MSASREGRRTILVSFSGIDGAGKSTQIENLVSHFRQEGLRVQVVRFWDDVAQLKGIRETSGHKFFKGDKGVGRPEAPISRRDKNVRSVWMTWVRLFLYLVDAMSLRLKVKRVLDSGLDLAIFDRYTYDELANLDLRNPVIRAYSRMITMIAPRPHISYLLDANPVQARARKPEYPLEFVRSNRDAYLRLAMVVKGITVVSPGSIHEVQAEVIGQAAGKLSLEVTEQAHNTFAIERN